MEIATLTSIVVTYHRTSMLSTYLYRLPFSDNDTPTEAWHMIGKDSENKLALSQKNK